MPRYMVPCDRCAGNGVVEAEPEEGDGLIECPDCEGTGEMEFEDNNEDAAYDRSQAERDLPL